MKKVTEVTISDIRSALIDTSSVSEDELGMLTDDQLLKEDLIYDLGLTSLDLVDITLEVERDLSILLGDTDKIIDGLNAQGSYKVADFIAACNKYAKSKTPRS